METIKIIKFKAQSRFGVVGRFCGETALKKGIWFGEDKIFHSSLIKLRSNEEGR